MGRNSCCKWSPTLAYVVGLITTDGSLSKDKRHIDFTSSDLQLLKTFQKSLSLKNKITEKSKSCSPVRKYFHIQFGDRIFYDWLLRIGLMQNKTYRIGKLNIPKQYFKDFLRGHLDGDGSIFTYVDDYMSYKGKKYTYNRLYVGFNSISHVHLKWIRAKIKKALNIKGALTSYTKKNRKIPCWNLRFAKKDSLKLLSWLYYKEKLPCLKRKRQIAELFLN